MEAFMKLLGKLCGVLLVLAASLMFGISVIAISFASPYGFRSGEVFGVDAERVYVETDEGRTIVFLVDDGTYVLGGEIEVGHHITAWFQNSGSTAFFRTDDDPPRYYSWYDVMRERPLDAPEYPAILVVGGGYSVVVGYLDDGVFREYWPRERVLSINIDEDTQIVSLGGEPFAGDIGDISSLAVVYRDGEEYSASGRFIVLRYFASTAITISNVIISEPIPDVLVTVDHRAVYFDGQRPVIVNGRTLVPVRGVFEELGFDVGWDNNTRQATLTRNDDSVVITVDSDVFVTNSVEYAMDVPAQIIGGSTMLPIRAVLESLGYSLTWNETVNWVAIFTGELTPVPDSPFISNVRVEWHDPNIVPAPLTFALPQSFEEIHASPVWAGHSNFIVRYQDQYINISRSAESMFHAWWLEEEWSTVEMYGHTIYYFIGTDFNDVTFEIDGLYYNIRGENAANIDLEVLLRLAKAVARG